MRRIVVLAVALVVLAGCKTPGGDTPSQKRQSVMNMHDDTLRDLYREVPAAKGLVQRAPGYAVFSNLSTKILLLGTGTGYGVLVDNRSGGRTYMGMSQVGAGLGAGIEDWRAVIIFNDATTMGRFEYSGWDFGGAVSASAVTDDAGDQFSRAISVQGMTIFTFTKHGLSAKAEVKGTKFWLDDELNASR